MRDLEGEGRAQEVYGSGLQLLPLEPEFVLKTHAAGTNEKVFINVCTCHKVRGAPSGGLQFALQALHSPRACMTASQAS